MTRDSRRLSGRGRPIGMLGAVVGLTLVLGSVLSAGLLAFDQLSARPPDIGFEPTAMGVADAMLRLAGVGPDDVVYDLGSGDGRIVNLAAERFGARGVGIELEPYLVEQSRRAATAKGLTDRVRFVEGDLFTTDISQATVVTLYLWPSVNARLESKLRQELRPGTRIVSNAFAIGHWIPDKTASAPDGTTMLLWTVPRRPARAPDVSFVPTPEPVVYEMLQLAGIHAGDVLYDLGSGDGRIPTLAALKYGVQTVGIEIDPHLVDVSRETARDAGLGDRTTFVEADLLTSDISRATVVTLSLSSEINARLEQRLRTELPLGARIVSHQWRIGTWRPDRVIRASDGTELFLWTVRRN